MNLPPVKLRDGDKSWGFRRGTASGYNLDAILAAVSDNITSAEDALTGLVRRVLLAALELRESRRRHEEDHRAT